jgi:4,5:9,10-diseco-3-hydroxy-5,9,17-trioxoandrosta-1(10),2-diene-4-oate hydrolase
LLENYQYALGEQYIDVDGVKLCYQDVGHGDTVLILPGLGTSIDFWQITIPKLAEHFRVVAVDLPGFGKSDKPDASYELSWIDDKILAFMDARNIPKANIIGGSMGGHLGLLLALDHPDRVEKLVMMGSTGDWKPPSFLFDFVLNDVWNERLITDYLRYHWPEFFPLMISHPSEMTQRLFQYQMALRADYCRYWPEGRASARALRSIFHSSCRERFSHLQTPLLLLWGENDRIHTLRHARFMHERTPGSQLDIVPDSSHEVMIDQPERFNSAVISFFKSTPQHEPIAMTTTARGVTP